MAGYIIYSLDWNKFKKFVEQPTQLQLTALAKLLRDALEEQDDEAIDWPDDEAALAQLAAKRLAMKDWYGDLSSAQKNLWEGAIFSACMDCPEIDVGFRVDNDGIYWDVIELAWKKLGVVPNAVSGVALSAFGQRPYRYHPPAASKSRDEFDQEQGQARASLDALGGMLKQFAKGEHQNPEQFLDALKGNKGVSQEHKNLIEDFLNDDDSEEDDDEDDDIVEWTPMHSMHAPEEVKKMHGELTSIEAAIMKSKNKDVRNQYEEDLMPALEAIIADGRMLFVQVDT